MLKNIIKYCSFTLFALILLVIIFILAAPWFLSTDSIRIRLAQELSSWTGYSVQLKSPPQISIFPKFKASVSGVVLSSPEDTDVPLMVADHIEFDLSLLSALQGNVSITESLIISPVFTLNEPVKNINDAIQKISQSEGALGEAIREARNIVKNNPKETNLNYLLTHPFGKIIIKNGTINYRKSDKGELETITHVDADLDLPVNNGQASIIIRGEWRSEMTELRLDAEQVLLLFAHVSSPIRFSLNSRRGGFTYSGMAQYNETFFFNGHLSARSPGLDQTMTWLGLEHAMGINVTAPIVWESSFNSTPERIELNAINFSLNDDTARGALEITNRQQTPLVSGSLAFQTLNLDTFLAAYFPDREAKRKYDFDFFTTLDFDVRVSSPEAQFSSLNITNLAAAIQLRDGRGIFDVGNANILGGLVQSNIQIFLQDNVPVIEARISGSGLNTQDILSAIQFPPIVEGKSNLTMSFKAPFVHWSKLLSAMDGTFSTSMSKGQFLSYDFSDFENRLKNEHFVVFPKMEKGVFPFKGLAAVGTFSQGLVTVEAGGFINGDKKYNFQGIIPFAVQSNQFQFIERMPQYSNSEVAFSPNFAFNIVQAMANSSTTVCLDVECLQNSLIAPSSFFLLGNENQLSITTPVKSSPE